MRTKVGYRKGEMPRQTWVKIRTCHDVYTKGSEDWDPTHYSGTLWTDTTQVISIRLTKKIFLYTQRETN